jgi:hypothetical protein
VNPVCLARYEEKKYDRRTRGVRFIVEGVCKPQGRKRTPKFSSHTVFDTPPVLTTHLLFSHLYVSAGVGVGFGVGPGCRS